MTEAEALLKIAGAIDHLADVLTAIGSGASGWLLVYLFFKNLGTSSDALNNVANTIANAIKDRKND